MADRSMERQRVKKRGEGRERKNPEKEQSNQPEVEVPSSTRQVSGGVGGKRTLTTILRATWFKFWVSC